MLSHLCIGRLIFLYWPTRTDNHEKFWQHIGLMSTSELFDLITPFLFLNILLLCFFVLNFEKSFFVNSLSKKMQNKNQIWFPANNCTLIFFGGGGEGSKIWKGDLLLLLTLMFSFPIASKYYIRAHIKKIRLFDIL